MLGPIIVSLVGISLPVVGGIWLAPKQDRDHARSVLTRQCRGYVRSLLTAAQGELDIKHLPAGLGSSSTYRAG
jgi:hypothetical protein